MGAVAASIASDEAGFPDAARLLENLPESASGEIIHGPEHSALCDCPTEAPSGIEVRWFARSEDKVLGDAARAALPGHAVSKIWFSSERGKAK